MKIRTHVHAAAIGYYTVQPGDNLTAISRKLYNGNPAYANQLCAINRDKIRDCNLIQPGWVLRYYYPNPYQP